MAEEQIPHDDRSTRIVCANAYKSSIFFAGGTRALKLLKLIRQSPLMAISPESGINAETVSYHAVQATIIGIITTVIVTLLLILGVFWNITSGALFSVADSTFGVTVETNLFQIIFRALAAGILGFESIFLLWFIRMHYFVRNNYKPTLKLPFIDFFARFFVAYKQQSQVKEQNVVVFGSYEPFVGSGMQLNNLQFVFDLSRSSRSALTDNSDPVEVDLDAIYARIHNAIEARGLDKLQFEQIMYANGQRLSLQKKILPNTMKRPIHSTEEDFSTEQPQTSVGDQARIYNVYRYHDMQNETTMSAFIHLRKYKKNLYAEAVFRVLLPVNDRIYNVDTSVNPGIFLRMLFMWAATGILFLAPIIIYLILGLRIFNLIKDLRDYLIESTGQRAEAKLRSGLFNYGISKTFRERIAYKDWQNYFVEKDIIAYWYAIQETFSEVILDELQDAGIDVSKQRLSEPYINNGVHISGGTINNSGQMNIGSTFESVADAVNLNPALKVGGRMIINNVEGILQR